MDLNPEVQQEIGRNVPWNQLPSKVKEVLINEKFESMNLIPPILSISCSVVLNLNNNAIRFL